MTPFPTATASSAALLGRLRRLLAIQAQRQGEMNRRGRRLVKNSIMATLEDCYNAGLGDEAADILREAAK